jgi:hypothetical protein
LDLSVARSFFTRDGAGYRATVLARGPWSAAHQHGGPGAALLAGALERYEVAAAADAGTFRIARVAIEFLRPVPLAGLFEVRFAPPRVGRVAQRLEAALVADGIEIARAHGLRLRTDALGKDLEPPLPRLPSPEASVSFHVPFFPVEPAYSTGMEIRIAEGAWRDLPIGAWSRPRVPLVEDTPASAVERTLLFADAESGIGPPVDPFTYSFVNADLTVYFARPPTGDWIGLRVRSSACHDGIGLAESELHDAGGVFGRAMQSLLIRCAAGSSAPD